MSVKGRTFFFRSKRSFSKPALIMVSVLLLIIVGVQTVWAEGFFVTTGFHYHTKSCCYYKVRYDCTGAAIGSSWTCHKRPLDVDCCSLVPSYNVVMCDNPVLLPSLENPSEYKLYCTSCGFFGDGGTCKNSQQ